MDIKVTVDRIEGEYAVLLIRKNEKYSIDWPVIYLPKTVQEGDILTFDIEKDKEKTEDAKKRVGNLLNKLKNKNKN